MNPIPDPVVDKVWQRIAELPEDEAEDLTTRMGQEQPALVGYMLAVDQDILNQEEREVLFYLGLVVWQIMSEEGELPTVSIEAVEAADDANGKMLEEMMQDEDADLQAVAENLMTTYPQASILQYAVSALVEAVDQGEIRADNIGVILIDVKTIVDCLDNQGLPPPPP